MSHLCRPQHLPKSLNPGAQLLRSVEEGVDAAILHGPATRVLLNTVVDFKQEGRGVQAIQTPLIPHKAIEEIAGRKVADNPAGHAKALATYVRDKVLPLEAGEALVMVKQDTKGNVIKRYFMGQPTPAGKNTFVCTYVTEQNNIVVKKAIIRIKMIEGDDDSFAAFFMKLNLYPNLGE